MEKKRISILFALLLIGRILDFFIPLIEEYTTIEALKLLAQLVVVGVFVMKLVVYVQLCKVNVLFSYVIFFLLLAEILEYFVTILPEMIIVICYPLVKLAMYYSLLIAIAAVIEPYDAILKKKWNNLFYLYLCSICLSIVSTICLSFASLPALLRNIFTFGYVITAVLLLVAEVKYGIQLYQNIKVLNQSKESM